MGNRNNYWDPHHWENFYHRQHGHWHKYHWHRHHHRGGRMIGKIISFAVGVAVGIFVDRNYNIEAPSSAHETWEQLRKSAEDIKEKHPHAAENVSELMEKVKALEKKYRKEQPSADAGKSE